MPNWCEGTLKVRGTIADLKNFVLKGLIPVDPIGRIKEPLLFQEEDENFFYTGYIKDTLYLKGTCRAFCEPEYIDDVQVDDVTEKIIILLPFKQAWEICANDLLSVCMEFNVDMKVQGFEAGCQFSQIVEIVNGEILKNETIKYDDWEWDCPCPATGG